MIRLSTGLRNAIMSNYGLGMIMNQGVIRCYNSSIPTTPDLAPSGTELARITTEGLTFIPGDLTTGAGLSIALISPGTLINDGNWVLTGLASGNITWFRWNWAGLDSLSYSTLTPRIDGLVGTAGDLVLASTLVTSSSRRQLDQFLFTLPLSH